MGIKYFIIDILPMPVKNILYSVKEKWKLNKVEHYSCNVKNLRSDNSISLQKLFDNKHIEEKWKQSRKQIEPFGIEDAEGGINPGDRKAIYYLINKLKPSSVLEVGTHIGASTVYIASSLYTSQIKYGEDAKLTTVDIINVNNTDEKRWLNYGINYSPYTMLENLNLENYVNFVIGHSLQFLENCNQKFDFIFLDGDHSATAVYQEIPLALKRLNKNGVILLHDYFPDLEPLWSNGKVLPGPCLAMERLKKEGENLTVLPLGELPWETKLNSNVTSLALVLKRE